MIIEGLSGRQAGLLADKVAGLIAAHAQGRHRLSRQRLTAARLLLESLRAAEIEPDAAGLSLSPINHRRRTRYAANRQTACLLAAGVPLSQVNRVKEATHEAQSV